MKKIRAKTIRQFIYYSLIIFLLISIFFIAFATYLQLKENSAKITEITQKEKNIVDMEENMTTKNLNNLLSDIRYLGYTFQKYEGYEGIGYKNLEEDWKAFSDSKKIYYKIRYIDTSGEEKIRINYAQEGSYASKSEELQNKKDRYYFQNTVGLEKNQIYVSNLDLNVEDGEIQSPIVPTIRFSVKVFGKDGGLKGIIVLSYSAIYMLGDYKDISSASFGHVDLLNSDGYWIVNDLNRDKEWSFMYKDKKSVSFKNEFSDQWETISKNTSGTIITDDGLYVYKSFAPFMERFKESGLADSKLIVRDEENWIIVTFVANDIKNGIVFNNKINKVILYTLERQILSLLIMLFISMAFSGLIIENRLSKEKISRFSIDMLTGVYNRRAGFQRLEKTYKNAMKKNNELSVCFIDVDGLKHVNDTFGHEVGNELIVCVTDAIKKCIRESDFIIRIGGDEFLIVFENASLEKAEEIWQRINMEYQKINETGNKRFVISVSHGVEEFKFDFNEFIDDIINSADEKMYNEKNKLSMHIRKGKDPQ